MIGTRRLAVRATRALAAAAVLLTLLITWVLSRPPADIDRNQRHFAELQRQVAAARESRAARATARGRIMRLRAQARSADAAQRAAFESEAAALEASLGWGDRDVVRTAVLATPLVSIRRPRVPADVVPVSARNGGGCAACHLPIATPGFEAYPAPFRTHPDLNAYVGSASPHPPSRVACAACHLGDGPATTFAAAGHSSLRLAVPSAATVGAPAPAAATGVHAWADPSAPGAMLPVGRTEAACAACHSGERYQPGATTLNEALVMVERGGCYACHDVPGMERTPKRGPDLRRVGAKLSPEWMRAWLANPRALKPATWMPRFWAGDVPSSEDAAAIDAVTAYLSSASEVYVPATTDPPPGDAVRGQALVESVGCLGCHVAGGAPRDESSVRRTFGQPLDAVGGKVTYAWLFDWVREPSRYSPATRMPNLRLSAQEAADVATYLLTPVSELAPAPAAVAGGDELYRRVIERYSAAGARGAADGLGLGGEPLRVRAGRTVIDALGCFNCHEIRGFEGRRRAVTMARRAVWLDVDARNLHQAARPAASGTRESAGPDFGFGPAESARLALALTAVAGRGGEPHAIGVPWHLVKSAGRTLVQERNCVGCHTIEGVGGDFVKLVAEPTLGPPLLTPEGSRVQPDWLRGFLHQPKTIRPWLSARMPTFGLTQDEIDSVGAYLRAIASANPDPTPAPAGVSAAAGKELFELLKCQQCHVLGATPKDQPTSNLAPDLRLAGERLQPEWVVSWLRNPSAILPGTRMPTFWPDYPTSFYPPFDKDGARQVRALRDHLVAPGSSGR